MGRYKRTYCFFVLLALLLPLLAQPLNFDLFSVNEGLTDRQITEIYLGDEGYVWVGTRDGLNRFDGYTFLPFGQGPFSQGGLSLGNIDHVGKDLEGKFAIFYRDFTGYFDRFDPVSFRVEQVQLNPSEGVSGFSRSLAMDELGRVFTVTISRDGTRLYEYTPKGFAEIAELEEPRNSISAAVLLRPLRNGQFLLFDTELGLRHLNAVGEPLGDISLRQLDASAVFGSGIYERMNFLVEGPGDRVYFSFFGHPGIYFWTIGSRDRPQRVTGLPADHLFLAAFEDDLGQLLFATATEPGPVDRIQHYFLLDERGKTSPYDELLKAGSRVNAAAAVDFREKIFLGTNDGLKVIESRRRRLANYLSVDQEEEFSQNLIRGIAEAGNGDIYFVEEAGQLYRLDPTLGTLDSVYLHQEDDEGSLLRLQNALELVYDEKENALWGIAQRNGRRNVGLLYRYDLASCNTKAYYAADYRFTALSPGPGGHWIVGATHSILGGQLLRFDVIAESFLPLKDSGNRDFLSATLPQCIELGQDGKLFVGTQDKGLFIFDPENMTHRSWSPEPWDKEAQLFNDYNVYAIHEDDDGWLWIGTRGGLHHFDPATETLVHYGRQDGLSSNIVSGIVPDTSGGYWLSTFNGLTHLLPGAPIGFRRYYRDDGLANDEFNRYSFLRSSRGRFYFGGVNGLTAFYPHELAATGIEAQVVITEVLIYGRQEPRRPQPGKEDIVVRPDEKGIAVSFALPATTRADRNRFRVKLAGVDEKWVELNNEHTARYSNLPAGRYELLVQGSDANGNYAAEIVSLPFRVRQYLWERSWFLAAMGLLIAGLVIGVLQSRSRERLRSEQLRTQLSSDIHDEVSGLLAGITLQTELLQSYTQDEHLQTRLKGVGEAGRKAMSKMSDVIWSIDSRRDTVGDLLQRMQEHADDVLLPLDIRYQFRTDGLGDKKQKISGSKRQDLYFIYKEAVNNTARHSNATQVSITLSQRANEFEMIIRDNGRPTNGFDARRSVKSGQGLANLQMRASRLDANLSVDPQSGYAIRLRMRNLV